MSNIIAGLFDNIEQAQDAQDSLLHHGFAAGDVCHFANNPPGQHDQFPIGGDENADPGARHAHAGTVAGAGMGAGAGAAVGAVVGGPAGAAVGAGVGAYVGSLAGTLNQLEGRGSDAQPVRRPAGVMVAARAEDPSSERMAVAVLQAEGAHHVERAQGEWTDGGWADFDPVSPPQLVQADASTAVPDDVPLPAGFAGPVYRVRPAGDKWEAELGDTRRAFGVRQEAVSAATSEAGRQPRAAIEVYGKAGTLVWREIRDGGRPQHPTAGAR